MSTLNERIVALLTACPLPRMEVDLALYRRLRAMQARMIADDLSLGALDDGGFEHVIYAALCAGVRVNEVECCASYDENTGLSTKADSP